MQGKYSQTPNRVSSAEIFHSVLAWEHNFSDPNRQAKKRGLACQASWIACQTAPYLFRYTLSVMSKGDRLGIERISS
jgi:hypothetical protein